MENSTKMFVIVAAFIIGLMTLYVLVYMFDLSASVPVQYERTKQDEMVLAFNAKFEKYDLKSDENNDGKLSWDDPDAKYELNMPSNSFADVISACNLVNDLNTKSEQDNVESVIIEFNIKGKTYSITPTKAINAGGYLPKNHVFEGDYNSTNSDMVDLFELMKQPVETDKYLDDVKYWDGHKLRYRYYFDAELQYGINTEEVRNFGKVVKIVFTMKETENYDSLP